MIIIAQANTDNLTGWVQLLLQSGVAVYMIYWFTTNHIQAQKEVANSIKDSAQQHSHAMAKVSAALQRNTDSNISTVLAIKELDSQHAILRLAAEQQKKMQDQDTPIT